MLPKLVGMGKAQELVLTGRVFNARDAPNGLFNYIVPSTQVMGKARELANEIASNCSTYAVALSRNMLLRNGALLLHGRLVIDSTASLCPWGGE